VILVRRSETEIGPSSITCPRAEGRCWTTSASTKRRELASLLRLRDGIPGSSDETAAYAGDTLWALAEFLGIGLVMPRAPTRTIACLAMSFSLAIEISQLYHAPWIDSIRQTTLGGLILGFGFLWSDLACYAVGVGLGVIIEIGVSALKERQN